MAATESHRSILSCDAIRISASVRSGNTVWKQPTNRVSTSGIFRLSCKNDAMIQARADGVEALARDGTRAYGIRSGEGFDKTPHRAILAGYGDVQQYLGGGIAPKQLSQNGVLDSPTERAAAHHPCIDVQAGPERAALQ